MRKRIIPAKREPEAGSVGNWLDLENIAEVEITSEDPDHPIENALFPGRSSGWRAAHPGEQVIRVCFDEPRRVQRIWLRFEEPHSERTQQFTLRWSPDNGRTFREVVRQQWNFSPRGAAEEVENVHLNVSGVTQIELAIVPDISGGEARASLAQLRVE
jgi:hypothetical protein